MLDWLIPQSRGVPLHGDFNAFWRPDLISSRTTTAGVPVNEEISLTYSACWAATRLLAGSGSTLPLPVYKIVDLASQGLMGEASERQPDHWLAKLLRRPNEEMDGCSFRSIMWQWQINAGNADAEIIRDGMTGEVVALLPIDPCSSRWERNPDDDRLELRVDEQGKTRFIDREDIFHVRSILTYDGFCGRGVIEHARETMGFGLSTERYGANWFGKGGLPRVVIEHPAKWDDVQRKAFREEWEDIYGGPDGHKVGVLGGGAQMKPLIVTAEDSQFLGTREYNVEEVARWYGVPPHMLQRMIQVTYSNVESLYIEFVRNSLKPWLRVWEDAIRTQLLNEDEQDEFFAKHDVDDMLRGDSESRASYYNTMVLGGMLTRNEVRRLENMDPVPGGDTFLVQGAMVPLDEEGKPESEFSGGVPGEQPTGQTVDEDDEESTSEEDSAEETSQEDEE